MSRSTVLHGSPVRASQRIESRVGAGRPEKTRHRLVTFSLRPSEFDWLKELLDTLEDAGYRRTRSAVIRAALAELRTSLADASARDIVKRIAGR